MASSGPQSNAIGSQAFKQQQQELVKLLTQHFHFQFYRMVTNPQAEQAEQLASSSSSYHLPSPIIPQAVPYTGRLPYTLGTSIGPHIDMNEFDLRQHQNSALPASHQLQHKHANPQQTLMGRQQAPQNGNHRLNLSRTKKPLIENSLLPIDQPRACSMSEINLFNALGLSNMTNNQLVLSLQQQQSILQASAAAAAGAATIPQPLSFSPQDGHNEPNADAYEHSTTHWPIQKPLNVEIQNKESTDETHKNPTLRQLNQSTGKHLDDSKEILKFSINTILGGGSSKTPKTDHPQQITAKPETSNTLYDQQLETSSQQFIMSINNSPLNTKQENEDQEEMRSINCDHNQSDSDDCTASLNQSPTPEAGSSILRNNNNQSDHSSANSQHLNGFMAEHHHQARLHNQNPLQHPFLNGSSVFPWAVASRGKPRRGMMRRAVFSDGQRVGLEKRFQLQKYISKPDRKKLAEKLGLRDSQVKIWFQNRRMKWRNSKERELLTTGGSREQTLPTRSNPNPDLSDVGETIKRLVTGSGTVES